jgi:F-type H+-transporting ATPase subunit delta
MSVQRIASRYAKSLIDLAVEQQKLERVTEDVRSFKELVKNRDFYLLLKSPVIPASKKTTIVDLLLKDKYDALTMAFLRILITKGREEYLPEIAGEFIELYKKFKSISTVRLTTASPMGEAAVEEIRQVLVSSSLTKDNIDLQLAVDPDIIGGFVLAFDDKIYDASIAEKLEKLRRGFVENAYISQIRAR